MSEKPTARDSQDFTNYEENTTNLVRETKPKAEYIGYSLSLCIKAVIEGHTQQGQIKKIIASTRATTLEEFHALINDYAKRYWRRDPEKGKQIALQMYEDGLIKQGEDQNISEGYWLEIPEK